MGSPTPRQETVSVEHITRAILILRGHRVLLDNELAALYGVETRVLNQAVRRNAERFPEDFRFQLTPAEAAASRSQSVISNARHGGRRCAPYAFTEHGAINGCHGQYRREVVGNFESNGGRWAILQGVGSGC